MIPKIIHYTWFSGEDFPEEVKACMDTWKKVLPDYEFILWDAKKLSEINNTFANEAVSVRKWAFASDFVRMYAVYNHGGIYIDTDIEMYKSFDPFLKHRMFIGREGNERWYGPCSSKKFVSTFSLLTSHCFGAEPGHPYLKECLDYFTKRHFIRTDNEDYPEELRYDMMILPIIQARVAERWGYDGTREHDHIQELKEGLVIYPHDYFDMPNYSGMKNVVCIHRQFGGWRGINGEPETYEKTHVRKFGIKDLLRSLLVCVNKTLHLLKLNIKIIPYRNNPLSFEIEGD